VFGASTKNKTLNFKFISCLIFLLIPDYCPQIKNRCILFITYTNKNLILEKISNKEKKWKEKSQL
jgi:hypothetical protein